MLDLLLQVSEDITKVKRMRKKKKQALRRNSENGNSDGSPIHTIGKVIIWGHCLSSVVIQENQTAALFIP